MAYRLSKTDRARLQELQALLRDRRMDVTLRYKVFVAQIEGIVGELNAVVDRYNSAARQAQAFVTEHAEDWRDDYEEKSDRWKESDAGQAAEGFIEEWERVDLDDVNPVQVLLPDPPALGKPLDLPEESD